MPVAVPKYTLGFVFFEDLSTDGTKINYILLLKKKKPESQAGKYNGIGGKFEKGETREQCMVREALEEANIVTKSEDWTFIGTLVKPKKWNVHIAYTFIDSVQLSRIPTVCREGAFLLTRVDNLPTEVMTNVRWLLPLALGFKKEKQRDFVVNYLPDEVD